MPPGAMLPDRAAARLVPVQAVRGLAVMDAIPPGPLPPAKERSSLPDAIPTPPDCLASEWPHHWSAAPARQLYDVSRTLTQPHYQGETVPTRAIHLALEPQ